MRSAERLPLVEVGSCATSRPKRLEHELVELLLAQPQRHG